MGFILFYRVVREGYVEIVEKFFESGVFVCLEDLYGYFFLYVVFMSGYFKIVQLLLNQDCDVLDKMFSIKLFFLYCVVKEGKLEVVKFLLERGVFFNVQNSYGYILLMLVVSEDYIDVVRFLVDLGVDFFVRDKFIFCVFYFVISKGSLRCFQVFLDKVV